MRNMHVAFCVEQEYGHIIPTLGIALELLKRGHRVSYAVTGGFAPMIRQIDAVPLIIAPPEVRTKVIKGVVKDNDCQSYQLEGEELASFMTNLTAERTMQALQQLQQLYRDCVPDVVIHDDCFDTAGRTLATEWGLKKIRFHSQFIDVDTPGQHVRPFCDDEMVLMTVPAFFQRNPQVFQNDRRFRFVGFVPEGRSQIFEPWVPANTELRAILVSSTTGLLPQIGFCKTMIEAFREQPWDVVLSVSGRRDTVSAIDPAELPVMPKNIQINSAAGNFDVLKNASLYVGQGGQGGTLEAIYRGVPQLIVPPTPYHYSVARRTSELGLGVCLSISEMSPESVRRHAAEILDDSAMLDRVSAASESMQSCPSAVLAGDAIEEHVFGTPVSLAG
jgi:UDP:flavonoid glycosyltransferase YjiC (YdhE family)